MKRGNLSIRHIIKFKNLFKGLAVLTLFVCMCIMICGVSVYYRFPDDYQSTSQNSFSLESSIPLTAKLQQSNNFIAADYHKTACGSYNANLRLLNVIPVKNVNIELVDETKLIPCGTPFGVKIFTEGVMIVGISDIKTDEGIFNPARSAGLKKGDIILNANGKVISDNNDILKLVEESAGESIDLNIRRNNLEFNAKLKPVKSSVDQSYKIGLWVRDSSAGIGTMTFFDPNTNDFAGLGHGICDIDTGELLPLSHGDIMESQINGVIKGEKGYPGELKGTFVGNKAIGNLKSNNFSGVYGTLESCPVQNEAIPIAMKQQVKVGQAQILTTVSNGEPRYYNIEVLSLNYNENAPSKNMVISITDPELLEVTGGIVQGMSGSPIIQDGRMIGAVTHVFVNDPTKGYGIFIENMINVSNSINRMQQDKAS